MEGRPRYSSTKQPARMMPRIFLERMMKNLTVSCEQLTDVILIIAGMHRVMRGTQGAALRRKPTRQENAPRGISGEDRGAFAALLRESHPKSEQSSKALSKQTISCVYACLAYAGIYDESPAKGPRERHVPALLDQGGTRERRGCLSDGGAGRCWCRRYVRCCARARRVQSLCLPFYMVCADHPPCLALLYLQDSRSPETQVR
jgi:hypothetical protein